MISVRVNDQELQLEEDEKLNAVQAAARAGVEIPHYCWHPALSVVASCRMCLVEAGERKPDGSVTMVPKLVPGCQWPMVDGTVIVTNSAKVVEARKATLEYLLLNHPLDCPVCDQAGECLLQDYSYRFGRAHSRLLEPKIQRPDKEHIGDQITLFTDRCIMCTRCIRFTREISGTAELQVIDRGSHTEIDIFPGAPCNNKLAGNVVDLCPVGALCSKDFLYKQRVWWLTTKPSVCPNCSTGCSLHVDQNEDIVYRVRPRVNVKAQGHFICDEGRFGWKYIHSPDRLRRPLSKNPDDSQSGVGWEEALALVRRRLSKAVEAHPEGVVGILSPWMTLEEAYLLGGYLKSLASDVQLAMGPITIVGEDDCYPKDFHGQACSNPKFVIRAEKCPNRLGVEIILRHWQQEVVSFEDLSGRLRGREFHAIYLTGGYGHDWIDQAAADALRQVGLLIVQDILPSPASLQADIVLPGGTFAEKDGTFVNHARLAQAIKRCIHSPGQARADGRILWELSGRTGLFHAGSLREEMAREIPELSKLTGDLGEEGIRLGEPQGLELAGLASTRRREH
jgi:NADH-quinone oxidoreductase subunit G